MKTGLVKGLLFSVVMRAISSGHPSIAMFIAAQLAANNVTMTATK